MVEHSTLELEEGEAPCYYKDDEENVDLDNDLSYIDEKIEHFLGHFQRDYDWHMVTAQTFGALCGGYGSFLRAEWQSPPVSSHPKTPHRNYNTSRSPKSLMEGAIQNLRAPSNAPPNLKLGTASITHFSQNSRVLPGDTTVKSDSCVLSTQVPERCSLKDETLNLPGNPTDQRTLKLRIKMNSDIMTQKKTEIYSGLGLNSPSSSMENSPEQSRKMPPPSQVTVDESPSNIIRVMTSFPVPGEALLSPLHDSLLFLVRKRKLDQQKLVPSSNGHQELSSLSVEESVSAQGNEQLSKGTVKVAGKGESVAELKLKNGMKNNTRIFMKRKSEAETLEGKELMPNENEVKGRFSSSELVKEERMESMSAQQCVKDEKHTSGCASAKMLLEKSVTTSQVNVPLGVRDDGKCKGYKISASKDDLDVSKCKEEPDLQRYNADKKGISHKDEKANVHGKRAKLSLPSLEGKMKSKEISSNEKPPIVLTKETLGFEMGVRPKPRASGGHGGPPANRKTQKLKSPKGKVRDKENDSLGGISLEQMDRMDLAERPTDDVEAKWTACLDKPKEKLSGKKIDNRSLSRDAPHSRQPKMENGFASEIMPAAAPFVIEENWVCCDSCQKWRLLPFGTKPEQLPEKWLCSMLNWLPQMNRCDISEEETTKALNALYQPPSSESFNNLHTQANGTASAGPAVDVLHRDQNYQCLSSHTTPSEGKKKHVKEIPNELSGTGLFNSTKNHLHEAVKNGIDQKEKQNRGGDAQLVRLKMKADQYACGTPKKPKRGEMHHADKIGNSDIDLGRVGLGSSTGLLSQARGQDIKYKDQCYSKDTKDEPNHKLQVSAKKLEDHTNVSLDGGSLDVRTCSRGDISIKKRKPRDWQDAPNNVETFQNCLHEGKVCAKEESSESGYREEKKYKISGTNGKKSKHNHVDDKSDRKSTVTQILMSGTKVQSIDATEKDKGIVKDQKPRKHSKKKAHQETEDGLDLLRRDLGSGHVSLAATSSSSKVSGSNRIIVISEEVKGSSVESVSSSPLRTCNSEKLASARGDASGKDDEGYGGFSITNNSKRCWDEEGNGGFSITNNSKRCWDEEGNGNGDRFGTTWKEKILCSSHPEFRKSALVSYQDGDANVEFNVKHRTSSGVCNNHLNSDNDESLDQRGQFLSNQHTVGHDNNDDRENKNHPGNAVQKSGMGSCFRSEDNVRSFTSNLDRNRTKVSDPVNGYSKKGENYESEIEPNHHAFVPERGNNVRHGLLNKCSSKSVNAKDAKYDGCREDHARQGSGDSGVGTQLKPKDYNVLDVKFSATQSPSKKVVLQLNLIQNPGGGQMQHKSTSGKSQLFSHFQGESKEETPSLCSRPVAGSEKEVVFQELPVNGAVNGHAPKSLIQSGNVANKNGVNCNLVHVMPDQRRATDASEPSPVKSSFGQTATNTLKEAQSLRDYADRLKNSGFDFERCEAYFQAALKFLQGATVLEICSSENGKYGDMTQLQVYTTTAKLCELCAHEYESHKEVASAALAYKCMEVAYMRVVYFKHSSTNRDRHELQATLNMAPQGESPSSSASDVDNLNNHVIAEKAILSKGSGAHVVAARNRPNFVRLLDFTQDVNFAMEASKKCQNAFAAACVTLEAHKNDCVSSIRRVVDFSFQDLEELIRLVKLAMEAISRSKFGASRG